jgi:hypothetical protein
MTKMCIFPQFAPLMHLGVHNDPWEAAVAQVSAKQNAAVCPVPPRPACGQCSEDQSEHYIREWRCLVTSYQPELSIGAPLSAPPGGCRALLRRHDAQRVAATVMPAPLDCSKGQGERKVACPGILAQAYAHYCGTSLSPAQLERLVDMPALEAPLADKGTRSTALQRYQVGRAGPGYH